MKCQHCHAIFHTDEQGHPCTGGEFYDLTTTNCPYCGKSPQMKFHEHDIVVTTKPLRQSNSDSKQNIRIGSVGTIIHCHPENHFTVEFAGNILTHATSSEISPERTCIYCGCTDSRACVRGCSWVWLSHHGNVGVCSSRHCRDLAAGIQLPRIILGDFRLWKTDAGKLWISHINGDGMQMDEKKFASHIEKFFTKHF